MLSAPEEDGIIRRGVDETGAFNSGDEWQAEREKGPFRVVRQDPIAGKRTFQFLVNDIGTVARRHRTVDRKGFAENCLGCSLCHNTWGVGVSNRCCQTVCFQVGNDLPSAWVLLRIPKP